MNKRIRDFRIDEILKMCKYCDNCPFKNAQTNFEFHCVIDNLNELDLDKEVEVSNEQDNKETK